MISLYRKGVLAGRVCEDHDDDEMKVDVEGGKFQILFFTPEALLLKRKWRQLIQSDEYQSRIKGL